MKVLKSFRFFARQQISKPTQFSRNSFKFEKILQDKSFLKSIGVNSFPINPQVDVSKNANIFDEDLKFIGKISIKDAISMANTQGLDVLSLDEGLSSLQIANFQQMVLKKVRIVQNKLARRSLKEDFRRISIKNSIKANDISSKLDKILTFVKDFWKIRVFIEPTNDSSSQFDISKVLAMDLVKILQVRVDSYDINLELTDNYEVIINLVPNKSREDILNALAKNKEIFESANLANEYSKLHENLKNYTEVNEEEPFTEKEIIDSAEAMAEDAKQQKIEIKGYKE